MGRCIEIVQPGLLTTVQDAGRSGFEAVGVPPGGAMDLHSYYLANLLVGNSPEQAALEFTLTGPTVFFPEGGLIAITGAPFECQMDGEPLPLWTALSVPPGRVINIGSAASGLRGYLAVSGGFDLRPVMASRSTLLRAGLGGLEGRAVRAGDILLLGDTGTGVVGETVPNELRLRIGEPLRVVLGPQDDYFDPDSIEALLSSSYLVRPESDRMGIRLAGRPLTVIGPSLISDGTVPGAIQVPADGQPIILGADGQTTGGYPKIATVISADLPLVGQLRPGDQLAFGAVGVVEARQAATEQWCRLGLWAQRRLVARRRQVRLWGSMRVEGHWHRVTVEEETGKA